MILYIIRHGDPIYNPDSLTPKGHLQAKALAKRFLVGGLDKIYSSPMIRAQQTAQPTAELLGLPIEIEPWTEELAAAKDFFVEKRKSDGKRNWIFGVNPTYFRNNESIKYFDNWYEAPFFKDHPEKDFKGGFERIQKASDEFLARNGYERDGVVYNVIRPNDEKIAVFCHAGFGSIWISHLLGLPPHLAWGNIYMPCTSVATFEFTNYENGLTLPGLRQMADLSHLYNEGLAQNI